MAVTVLVVGCTGSNDLTRPRATELIQNSKDFSLPVYITLPAKREWPTEAESMNEPEEKAKERAIDSYAKTNAEVAAFRYLGLIDFRTRLVEAPSPSHKWWRFELELVLTEQGEQEAIESLGNKRSKEIAVARRELIEVTGIGRPKAGTAQVEFTWQQMPTPAGEAFDTGSETYRSLPEWLRQLIAGPPGAFGRSAVRKYGAIRKGVALLQLYEDGWRVQVVQF